MFGVKTVDSGNQCDSADDDNDDDDDDDGDWSNMGIMWSSLAKLLLAIRYSVMWNLVNIVW